jgi:hypothetical protein
VLFIPLCPGLRKNIKKTKAKKNKNLIPTSAKRQNRGILAIFFYVSCWILADTALVVNHLSSLFLACCHICSNIFLGQQLGQVLLLTCVPHTYTAFEPSQAPPSPEQNRYPLQSHPLSSCCHTSHRLPPTVLVRQW